MAAEGDPLHPLLEAHLEAGRGERVALRTPQGSWTYAQLAEQVNRAGGALRQAGLEPEQRVAFLLPDGIELAAAFLGAMRIGAVAVPLNTRLSAREYRAMLADCRAKLLLVSSELLPEVEAILPELPRLRRVFVVGGGGGGHPGWEEAAAGASAELAPEPVGGDDMAFWLYTSGTTGAPKAAVHLHRVLEAGRHYGEEVLGVTADDRIFATSKLFFAYALGNALLIPLRAGAQSFLLPDWADLDSVLGVLREFRPSLLFSVPTFYNRLLQAEPELKELSSLRLAVSAGERLPAAIFRRFGERYGVPILDGIGATETLYMFLSNRPHAVRPGSSGQPVPGTEARILDAEGGEVGPGGTGVLWVKTPSAAAGYWNRLDRSRETFVGEWYRTRDVFTRDRDGFYFHQGREDDLFKVAGQWVQPAEVEDALREHPAVADVGVVGAPDESGLVKPFAFVIPRPGGPDPERLSSELMAHLVGRVASHQLPRRIELVGELPRTATGKLQRFRLRQQVVQPGGRSRA